MIVLKVMVVMVSRESVGILYSKVKYHRARSEHPFIAWPRILIRPNLCIRIQFRVAKAEIAMTIM